MCGRTGMSWRRRSTPGSRTGSRGGDDRVCLRRGEGLRSFQGGRETWKTASWQPAGSRIRLLLKESDIPVAVNPKSADGPSNNPQCGFWDSQFSAAHVKSVEQPWGKGGLFDQANVKCFGFSDADTINKRIKQGGYCVITDTDDDHAYLRYEANDTFGFEWKGTFDYMGWTGKYKGITGRNTYRLVGSGRGRVIFNDAQPRKVPVLGVLGIRGERGGPDYLGQHFFGGMRALGWIDNY